MSKRQYSRAATRQPRVVAGFKTFFVCLVIAGILAAGVRLYFSPPRIENFLRNEIARSGLPFKLEFAHARLSLNRGLLPTFAIDVTDVHLSHFAPCATEPFVQTNVLVLPVDWFQLLFGNVKLGTVVASGLNASADRMKCEVPLTSQNLTAEESRKPAQAAKPWFKEEDLERVKKVLSGIEIQDGTVYFDNSKKSVKLSYLDLWHKGDGVLLQGELQLPAELTYGEEFPSIQFKGIVTKDLARLDARSSFDEGELGASLDLTQTDDPKAPNAKVIFRAGAMPLSIFSDFLQKLGVLSNSSLHPKFLWLTCDASSEGPLPKLIKETPLKIDNCAVEGDAGRIDIGPAVRNEERVWQPFKIEIKKLNIQDLFTTFSQKGPTGVFTSFGSLKGTISYLGKDHQSFDGSVENAELYFSNQSVRETQKISSVGIEAVREEGKVSGKILNLVLAPGKFDGEVNFSFSNKFENGTIGINATDLSLDPQIEKLMADGVFETLSVKGQLQIQNRKIANWKGILQSASYDGAQLKFVKPTVNTSFTPGHFDISAQASKGELSPDSRWLRWAQQAAGDLKLASNSPNHWIPISNIKTSISVEPQLIGWKNASLTATQNKVQLISTGEIRENKEAAGLLIVNDPAKKSRKFSISGSPFSPKLKEVLQ